MHRVPHQRAVPSHCPPPNRFFLCQSSSDHAKFIEPFPLLTYRNLSRCHGPLLHFFPEQYSDAIGVLNARQTVGDGDPTVILGGVVDRGLGGAAHALQ